MLPSCVCFSFHSGGDYMVSAKVEEYRKQIRRKLGERLEYCAGNVVVLFDELQKAAPGTLDGEICGTKIAKRLVLACPFFCLLAGI